MLNFFNISSTEFKPFLLSFVSFVILFLISYTFSYTFSFFLIVVFTNNSSVLLMLIKYCTKTIQYPVLQVIILFLKFFCVAYILKKYPVHINHIFLFKYPYHKVPDRKHSGRHGVLKALKS